MLAAGGYAWNSGMFLMRAGTSWPSLSASSRSCTRRLEVAFEGMTHSGEVDAGLYGAVKSMPIDKAVMERSQRVAMVPCDPGWSDVGSWHALWELMDKDEAGNAVQGDTLLIDARDNLVRSEKRVVALAGVEGLAVVETADAVLVARREMGEAIRGVVDRLVAGRPQGGHGPRPRGPALGHLPGPPGGPGLQGQGGDGRPRLPAHAPVPPRPRRALGHRRRECRGRAG